MQSKLDKPDPGTVHARPVALYQQWQYGIPGLRGMAQICAEGSYPDKRPGEKTVWRAAGVAAQGAVENMKSKATLAVPVVRVRVSKGLKHVKTFRHRPEACCGVTKNCDTQVCPPTPKTKLNTHMFSMDRKKSMTANRGHDCLEVLTA